MPPEKSTFRIIIAGGGVAGLTLANALERANIDYLLLEAGDQIAPPAGASIAVQPNGSRILDQIGALDDIYDASIPSTSVEEYKNGKFFNGNDLFRLQAAKCGYSLNFINRQSLLQSLYRSVSKKEKILVRKRVSRVDCNEDRIVAQCKDGTSYEGAVIVGADGVHSMVRQEMWRHMDLKKPGMISDVERCKMTAEYSCIYGISKPVKHLRQGVFYRTYGEDLSFLTTLGRNKEVFWFVFQKLDRKYTVPNVPRFTKQDAEAQAEKLFSQPITDQVSFQDIWEQRESYLLAPLEEALYSNWTWERFACIGDSAHKWTPNAGLGGNNAIEDAAALANSLHKLTRDNGKASPPSCAKIAESLKAFQAQRYARAEATFKISYKVTRLEALRSKFAKLMALYIIPNSGEFLANNFAAGMIGSEKLDFLPDPERSLTGSMAFNQNYGVGKEESLLRRVKRAFPLLILGFLCHTMLAGMQHSRVLAKAISSLDSRRMDFGPNQTTNSALIYHGAVSWLEQTFQPLATILTPSITDRDPTHHLQLISFLSALCPIYIIFLLESYRRANSTSFARLPLIFTLASLHYGIGSIIPLYFLLHYIQSPLSKFAAFDQRLINVAAAWTALPAFILACVLPMLWMYFAPPEELSRRWNINNADIWPLFPMWISMTHYILKTFCVKDTTKEDRIHNTSADLPYIRFAVRALAVVSAIIFNWVRWQQSSASLLQVLLTNADWTSMSISTTSLTAFETLDLLSGMNFLSLCKQTTQLPLILLAAFFWLGLLFKDLKEAEMMKTGWVRLIAFAVLGTLICGPGATAAIGWLWREEVLASRRAKGAAVRMDGGEH